MAGSIYTAVAGWAVLGGIGFYIWLMSHQRKQRATRRGMPMRPAEKAIEAQKEPKSRKSRKESGQSGGELGKGAIKRTEKRIEPVREVETNTTVTKDTDKDAEIEFARRLSNAKTGTLLASKPQVGARHKTQKQKRAQEKPVIVETSSDNGTAPSSAAGGDDEHTPSSSPEMSATTKSDDPVADMLQPVSPGPSVMRITEPTKPSQPKKVNRPQTYEPVETKKQRQNRKKAEAKKLALQEEEKERKILMEKQRRTAREAEGRAAKDGSTFMASKAPSTSAWTPSSSTANGQENTDSKVELLDTYEPSSSKVTPAPAPVYSQSQEMGDLYPEEKQFFDRQLYEDSNWQTVKEKKSRKGKKPGAEQDVKEKQETGTNQAAPLQQEDFGHPPVTTPSKPGDSWDTTVVHVEPNGEVKEYDRVVQDSEWEVS